MIFWLAMIDFMIFGAKNAFFCAKHVVSLMSNKLQLRLQPGNQALGRLVSQRTSHQPIIEMLGVPGTQSLDQC
jgi:hypothetical protein